MHLPESPAPRNPIIVGKTANYIEHGFIFYLQLIIFAPQPLTADPANSSRGAGTLHDFCTVWQQQWLPRSKDPQHVNHAAWSSASHFFLCWTPRHSGILKADRELLSPGNWNGQGGNSTPFFFFVCYILLNLQRQFF